MKMLEWNRLCLVMAAMLLAGQAQGQHLWIRSCIRNIGAGMILCVF